MNTEQMPERIWLVPSELSESTVWTTQEVEDPNEPGQAAYIRTDLVSSAVSPPLIQKGCFTVVGDLLDHEITAVIAAYEATGVAAWTEGDIYNDKYAVGFQKINIDTDYGQGGFDTAIVLSCVSKDEAEELLSCGCEMREVLAEDIIAALPQLLAS